MAHILIRGMEMPNDGVEWICFVKITNGTVEFYDPTGENESVFYDAVEIPPHGRLIDADAVSDRMKELMHPSDMANNQWFINTLREMPTIIPASEEVKDNG